MGEFCAFEKQGLKERGNMSEITCREISEELRKKIIQMGVDKSFVKYGIFERVSDKVPHVVVIVDGTGQLFKDVWVLKVVKP